MAERLEALAGGPVPTRIDEDTWDGDRTVAWHVPAAMWSLRRPCRSRGYSVGRPKLRSALVVTLLASLAALLLLWRFQHRFTSQ